MESHYYSKTQENVKSNPTTFSFPFADTSFTFHTDHGVFSKDYVDYGSYVLLKNFQPNALPEPILDMGAGYGAIGIVLAKLYDKPVDMCEINERAFHLIKQNIVENKVNQAFAYHSDLYTEVEGKKYSSIVTNPPIRAGKSIVYQMYEGAYRHLVSQGELWVVIQKKQGAPSSKAKLEEIFGNCTIIKRDKGYYILKSVKEK